MNFWYFLYFMGWGSWEGGNNFNNNFFQSSAAAGSWKFWISYSCLVLLRDVEKETHKHKVLWEKYFSVPQIGFGRSETENDYIFLSKMLHVVMIFWKSWGGGHGGRGTTTIITATTFSPPPGVRNFGFSIFALCLLRDVEKETHKHTVLWE